MQKNGLTKEEMAYVGDDWIDLDPMRSVGMPIAVANAVAQVKKEARYITAARGGEGAVREAWEEAGARIEVQRLSVVFDIPFAGQTTFAFLARLTDPAVAPGPESLEVRLFAEDEIPWRALSFRTVTVTLRRYFEDRRSGRNTVHMVRIDEPSGP